MQISVSTYLIVILILRISCLDVVVDGPFVEELKDNNLPWKGSSNQRVIDVKTTLQLKKTVLYA